VVCPSIAKDFDVCVKAKPADMKRTSDAYTDMIKCLELFEIESRAVLQNIQPKNE